MKQQYIFWFVIIAFFFSAVGGIFWLNYSFGQEQKKLFADIGVGVTRPPREVIDTSLWKIYENKKFGFSFKYPPELQVFPCVGSMLFCLNVGEKNISFQDNGFAVRIYDVAKLTSRDESGFTTREINGFSWRFKIDDTQAFRTDFGRDKEFRIFANEPFELIDTILSTFKFTE